MKKNILLIGKFNSVSKDLQSYLAEYVNVQICPDNYQRGKSILSMYEPELILISLTDLSGEISGIFEEIKTKYSHIPVICIGNKAEQQEYMECIQGGQFQMLTRPVSNQTVLRHIQKKLGIYEGVKIENEKKPNNGKKHILLVDDNAVQLRAYRGLLKEKYDVSMATSAMEAMVIIGKNCPDLIFLDYDMPVCDGKEAFEALQKMEMAKEIPVVFLTGIDDAEHIQAVLKLKPAGYLLKPVEQKRIFDVIHELLGS